MNEVDAKKNLYHRLSQWGPLILSLGLSAVATVYVARNVCALEASIVRVGFFESLITLVPISGPHPTGYGPRMVGIMGGMHHVSLWRFVWTAAIPNAVGALVFVFGGQRLKTLL